MVYFRTGVSHLPMGQMFHNRAFTNKRPVWSRYLYREVKKPTKKLINSFLVGFSAPSWEQPFAGPCGYLPPLLLLRHFCLGRSPTGRHHPAGIFLKTGGNFCFSPRLAPGPGSFA